jgi:hypothetical protein
LDKAAMRFCGDAMASNAGGGSRRLLVDAVKQLFDSGLCVRNPLRGTRWVTYLKWRGPQCRDITETDIRLVRMTAVAATRPP